LELNIYIQPFSRYQALGVLRSRETLTYWVTWPFNSP